MRYMRHPDLPDNDPIQVVDSQIPHLASAGWVEIDAPEPAKTKDEADGSKPGGESKTPRRPSAKKGED